MKRGFTLLLADDSEDDVLFFQRALTAAAVKAGVPVRLQVTQDGAEALEYLSGEGKFANRHLYPFPQIIVTDLKMPRLSGLDLLAWLKTHDEFQRVPKILISGSCEEQDVDEAYRLGVNTYFQKPAGPDEYDELVFHIVSYWAHTERPVIRPSTNLKNLNPCEGSSHYCT